MKKTSKIGKKSLKLKCQTNKVFNLEQKLTKMEKKYFCFFQEKKTRDKKINLLFFVFYLEIEQKLGQNLGLTY